LKVRKFFANLLRGGLNGVAAGFRPAIRARLTWPGGVVTPRPVGPNTWKEFIFDLNPEDVTQMAEAAAQVGELEDASCSWMTAGFRGGAATALALATGGPTSMCFRQGLAAWPNTSMI